MNRTAIVIGEGRLADLLAERLAPLCRVARRPSVERMEAAEDDELGEAALAVVADETPETTDLYAEGQALSDLGVPTIRVAVHAGEAQIGPFVRPGRPGCALCAATRRWTADLAAPREARKEREAAPAGRLSDWHVALMLAHEVSRWIEGDRPLTEGSIYLIDRRSLKSSLHPVVADPLCPLCGQPPEDSSARAAISLQPAPKPDAASYRVRSVDGFGGALRDRFCDSRTGIVSELFRDEPAPFASVAAIVPSLAGIEVAGGRSHQYPGSETAALLEALERHCGRMPRGVRPIVQGSFNQLEGEALDPRSVGLYSNEQYARPGFPFEPFDPDMPIDWMWGFSLARERPILVPLSLAYYSSASGESWVNEGSNGCAIGGCLEEAIVHGMLEAVERDAFLMTWYGRLPLSPIDPMSSGDKELELMLHRLRAVSGYETFLFRMTMENRIPAVLAVAKTMRPWRMNLLVGAGAHLDPLRAAKSAIHEAAGLAEGLQDRFAAEREELERMLRDPFRVSRMEHHSLLYGLPQAEDRLAFLLRSGSDRLTFAQAFAAPPARPDLTDDLRAMVETFKRLGLETIAVDQTSPEIGCMGLRCVKVLIPGLLPMTFGHPFARLEGLERVLRIPAELGYAPGPLAAESLHEHPHPFP